MLLVVTTGCVGWVALKWLQFTRIPCQSVGGMELAQLLVRYRGDLGKMVVSLNATYGHAPLKVFLFGVVRLILVSSPGMQELSPMPKGTFYAMLRVFFGRNLITLNHEAHRRHRRVMSQGFSVNALNAVIPSINRHAERLVKAWGSLKEVNVEEWMTRVTFDIISDQAFGYDANCVEESANGNRFAHNCCHIASMVMHHYLHAPGLAHIYKRLHGRVFSEVDRVIYDCIARRRKERAVRTDGGSKPIDLLDLMLSASIEGGWTDEDLRDECFIMFLAGHETTAETLSWVLAHVATDQALQERLRAEVCKVGPLRKETLQLYPEVTKVCKEALRLYPPAFMITRYGEEAVTIDGCPMPQGYDYMINLIGLQRTPAVFASAETFDASRWDGEVDSGYFQPFSFGTRQCLGKDFFWLEAKAVLGQILSKYKLHADRIPDWSTLKISTQFAEPLHMRLTPLELVKA